MALAAIDKALHWARKVLDSIRSFSLHCEIGLKMSEFLDGLRRATDKAGN